MVTPRAQLWARLSIESEEREQIRWRKSKSKEILALLCQPQSTSCDGRPWPV